MVFEVSMNIFFLIITISLILGGGFTIFYFAPSKINLEPSFVNDDGHYNIDKILKSNFHSMFPLFVANTVYAIPFTENHTGIWHSAMVDESGYERVTQKDIVGFENNANKKLALIVFSNDWYDGILFPKGMINAVKQSGSIPIVRMGVWKTNGNNITDAGPYTMSNIYNGEFDDLLRKWANEAKATDVPILVDFGYEANNNQFPWSKQGPLMYIDAYRHLVTIFREQNASNVFFVYHPDLGSNPDDMKKWYPGDDYMDWILVSAYGEDDKIGALGVLNKSYSKLEALSTSKPLGIEEWGIGSPKDTKDTLAGLKNPKFQRIKILSIWNEGPVEGIDRRIEQSPQMLNAYREGIKDPFYLSKNFDPVP